MVSELHAAARKYAEAGIPVFPCIPGTKTPATANGFHDASTDPTVIDGWWTDNPNLNPAFCPHEAGLGVIDIDGAEGEEAWQDFQIEHGFAPQTREIATPRGGRHLYFRGILPATQSKLAKHIDTRGVGSYVLIPPSVFAGHGSYRYLNDLPPADLPEAYPAYLDKLKKDAAKAAVSELDLPQNVARAERLLRDYVKGGHVAIEGQMGDGRTFAVACEVMNLGLTPEMAFEILEEIWNPECLPPWEPGELWTKVENASRYSQNEAGAWAVEPARDVFARALDKLAADDPTPARRFRLWTLEEIAALPLPEWLIPDMMPRKGVSLFYGPGGSYKSFLVLQFALELARDGRPVIYIGAEGGRDLELRAAAWKMVHEIDGELPLRIVQDMPWASDGGMIQEFIDTVKESTIRPELIVIDTAARMMVGLNENDAKDMGLLVAAVDTLKRALDCAVAVVHHTGKDASRGARGSAALEWATDAAFEIKADKATKAVEMWCRRQKGAAERERPWTFEGKAVGQSLVFQPTSESEHRALTKADDMLAPKKIGAKLRALNAVGIENAVTTHVLAGELVAQDPDQSDEAREALVSRMVKVLAHRAKGPLLAYAEGSGASLVWFVV